MPNTVLIPHTYSTVSNTGELMIDQVSHLRLIGGTGDTNFYAPCATRIDVSDPANYGSYNFLIRAPSLQSLDLTGFTFQNATIVCSSLTVLPVFNVLSTITVNSDSITSLTTPGGETQNISLTTPLLTAVTVNPYVLESLYCPGASLTTSSVDSILASLAGGTVSGGSVDLTGGTSSPPGNNAGAQAANASFTCSEANSISIYSPYISPHWISDQIYFYFVVDGTPYLPEFSGIGYPVNVFPGSSNSDVALALSIEMYNTGKFSSVSTNGSMVYYTLSELGEANSMSYTSSFFSMNDQYSGTNNYYNSNVVALIDRGWSVSTN
jgi:hypothetical protein